jgi:hypothetical protein
MFPKLLHQVRVPSEQGICLALQVRRIGPFRHADLCGRPSLAVLLCAGSDALSAAAESGERRTLMALAAERQGCCC